MTLVKRHKFKLPLILMVNGALAWPSISSAILQPATHATSGNALTFSVHSVGSKDRYRNKNADCNRAKSCPTQIIANKESQKQSPPNPIDSIIALDGTQLNQVTINWSEFSPAASMFENSGYQLEIVDTISPSTRVTRLVPYVANQARTSIETTGDSGLPSGVLLIFRVRACSNYNTSLANCGSFSRGDPGFALARFPGISPNDGGAQIGWNEFSPNTQKYRLERCTTPGNRVCDFIEVGNALSFLDASAVAGQTYRYSVFACRNNQNSSCVKTGDTKPIRIREPAKPNRIATINATDGTQLNQISLNWSEFAPTASRFINPGYQLEISDSNSVYVLVYSISSESVHAPITIRA